MDLIDYPDIVQEVFVFFAFVIANALPPRTSTSPAERTHYFAGEGEEESV